MLDLLHLQNFTVPQPADRTLWGDAADFDRLPAPHQAQISFLNPEARQYLYHFLPFFHLITGNLWQPFAKGNFRSVAEFTHFEGTENAQQNLKKWLFQRGLPFGTPVIVLPHYNDYPALTTWKMVVKYAPNLFWADDVVIFDQTLNWCLFYYHENHFFFGKGACYDPQEMERKMQELNEKKKKFPPFKHPYL